jgi:hypothetical protein
MAKVRKTHKRTKQGHFRKARSDKRNKKKK